MLAPGLHPIEAHHHSYGGLLDSARKRRVTQAPRRLSKSPQTPVLCRSASNVIAKKDRGDGVVSESRSTHSSPSGIRWVVNDLPDQDVRASCGRARQIARMNGIPSTVILQEPEPSGTASRQGRWVGPRLGRVGAPFEALRADRWQAGLRGGGSGWSGMRSTKQDVTASYTAHPAGRRQVGAAGVMGSGSVRRPMEERTATMTSGSWISAMRWNVPPQSHRRTSIPNAR